MAPARFKSLQTGFPAAFRFREPNRNDTINDSCFVRHFFIEASILVPDVAGFPEAGLKQELACLAAALLKRGSNTGERFRVALLIQQCVPLDQIEVGVLDKCKIDGPDIVDSMNQE